MLLVAEYGLHAGIRELLHTGHNTGIASYGSHAIRELLHTVHNTGIASYASQYGNCFIRVTIQELPHTGHNA